MSKTVQKLVTAVAAAGLVLTPVAAQANTRAGDSASVYGGSQSQPGLGRGAEGEGLVGAGAGDFIAWLLVGLWATGIIVIIVDDDDSDDDDNQSPGAN